MQKTEQRDFTDDEGLIQAHSTQLPALRAFKLMTRLGKLLGPAMGQLKGVKLKAKADALLPVLTALFESLEPDEADGLAQQILEGTHVVAGGKAVTLNSAPAIDAVFGGRLLLMLRVMAFAVEVNYRDFFRGLAPSAGGAKPASP